MQQLILKIWYATALIKWLKILLPLEKLYSVIAGNKRKKIAKLEAEIYTYYQSNLENQKSAWRLEHENNHCAKNIDKNGATKIKLAKKSIAPDLNLVSANRHVQKKIPLIIVGNISVGGTGKTPVVVAICQFLQTQNYRVAIISRGYGGKPQSTPQLLDAQSSIAEVGDEAFLIYKLTGASVIVDKVRARALNKAIELGADVIISDDGLQHFGMVAQIKYMVVDANRKFGNCHLLPLGPLRENLPEVISSVDGILQNLSGNFVDTAQNLSLTQELQRHMLKCGVKENLLNRVNIYNFGLQASNWLNGKGDLRSDMPFKVGDKINALAGIGNPQRFFNDLTNKGLEVIEHIYPDHAQFDANALKTTNNFPWVMTAKDGVKLQPYLQHNHWIYNVQANFNADFYAHLLQKIKGIKGD